MIAFKSWNDPELVYYIEIYTKIDQIIEVTVRGGARWLLVRIMFTMQAQRSGDKM